MRTVVEVKIADWSSDDECEGWRQDDNWYMKEDIEEDEVSRLIIEEQWRWIWSNEGRSKKTWWNQREWCWDEEIKLWRRTIEVMTRS